MHDLPRASRVLATLRELIGVTGVIQMKDYGHGLGAVHVTVPSLATPATNSLSFSEDWQYVGSEIEDDDTDEVAACMEFSRWVRLDAI